ncbi:MAG: hypothetical protein LLG15_02715 [Betaproteobacteria bacterium]|nr:hypothetical protein [Betaproteobacteria bacterium]
MDEQAFRETCRVVNPLACPFEKAILICQCGCREAGRINIAEREAINCLDVAALEDCTQLLGLLRHNAAFALKLTHIDEVLPHAKHVKVQCGGLLGLQGVLQPESAEETQVADIRGLVLAAQTRFGSLQELPYSEIVRGIAGFQARRRTGPR